MTTDPYEAVETIMAPAILRSPLDPDTDGTEFPPSQENIEAAKVWAHMAIAHEQRTANLIAFLDHAEGDQYEALHAQVSGRLGLA